MLLGLVIGAIAGGVSLANGNSVGKSIKEGVMWGVSPLLGALDLIPQVDKFTDTALLPMTNGIADALRSPENIAAEDALKKLEQDRINRKNEYKGAVAMEGLQWEDARATALERAGEVEQSAKQGFAGAAENTYLGNLQAANQITGMSQQSTEMSGQITSANAAMGTKQNIKYADVINEQMANQLQLNKTTLERSTKSAMSQAKGSLDMALDSASRLRSSFSEGGRQYGMYQQRLANMRTAYEGGQAMSNLQHNYLQDMYDSTSLNFTKSGGGFNWNALWNWGAMGFSAGQQTVNTIGTAISIFG